MPRETAYKPGDVLVVISPVANYYYPAAKVGDVIKVQYDSYDARHFGQLMVSARNEPYAGKQVDYIDSCVRKIHRSDMIDILQKEASVKLKQAQAKFSLIGIYQRFPTVEAEVLYLLEKLSEEGLTEEQVYEKLQELSFKISPLKEQMTDPDKFRDDLNEFL